MTKNEEVLERPLEEKEVKGISLRRIIQDLDIILQTNLAKSNTMKSDLYVG